MFLARRPLRRHIISRILAPALLLVLGGCLQMDVPPPPRAPVQHYETISAPAFPPARQGAQPSAAPKEIAVTRTVKVGLLLPLSGRHADLGRALQNAATLALFDRYAAISPQLGRTKVELLPKDTGDTAEAARGAAQQAIDEGATLLIGPVFSDTVQAVTAIAQQASVPVISFSNNPGVATRGVYIFGFSPEEQANRIVRYAAQQGMQSMGALVPNSPYGQSVLGAASRALATEGQTLAAQGIYDAQGVGLDEAIDSIIPPGTEPKFTGLFLPEGSTALDTMIRTLDARGVRSNYRVQLLGTGLWDDAALVRRVNLEGAWFASSPPTMTAAFENRFKNTYRYLPPRIASLSYDAVSLAVTLATAGRAFDEATLTHAGGFSGPANGIFRFRKDGTSERGLAVVQIKNGLFSVLSDAPTAFPRASIP